MSLINLFSSRRHNEQTPIIHTNVESIGRSGAGKSATYTAVNQSVADQNLSSGLFFSSGDDDPAATIGRLNETRDRIRDLADSGLTSTLDDRVANYHLSDGEFPRVQFNLFECIGQVLTHPDQDERSRSRYERYLRRLPQAQGLWVYAPLPHANLSGKEEEQFQYDVKVANTYLRTALKLQQAGGRKCCVSLVLTKIDGMFSTPSQARQQLSDDLLMQALRPLVNTITHSNVVESAVIAPTSAMGFGQTRILETAPVGNAHEDVFDARELAAEPTWIFREGGTMDPFNISGLLVWTLLHSILPQEVNCSNGQGEVMANVARSLEGDLRELSPWLVPIKTR